MQPREFLELLWSGKPEDLFILIWTLQDKRSRWCLDVAQAAAVVEASRHMDVYTGVGLSPADFGPHQRCPADKIVGIAGLGADFDLLSDAHANKALPKTIHQALSIIPPATPPSITIATGNGLSARSTPSRADRPIACSFSPISRKPVTPSTTAAAQRATP